MRIPASRSSIDPGQVLDAHGSPALRRVRRVRRLDDEDRLDATPGGISAVMWAPFAGRGGLVVHRSMMASDARQPPAMSTMAVAAATIPRAWTRVTRSRRRTAARTIVVTG